MYNTCERYWIMYSWQSRCGMRFESVMFYCTENSFDGFRSCLLLTVALCGPLSSLFSFPHQNTEYYVLRQQDTVLYSFFRDLVFE